MSTQSAPPLGVIASFPTRHGMADWHAPNIEGAASFAKIGQFYVGHVGETAIDGQWMAAVERTAVWSDKLHCYASSERRARYYVERWLAHHAPDVSTWPQRRPCLQGHGLPPRKPKGADDRS